MGAANHNPFYEWPNSYTSAWLKKLDTLFMYHFNYYQANHILKSIYKIHIYQTVILQADISFFLLAKIC